MPVSADHSLRELLGLMPVGLVGCADDASGDSHAIPLYLVEHGYEIIPISTAIDNLFGTPTYPTIAAAPDPLPLVAIFPPVDNLGEIVDPAIQRDDVSALWFHRGLRDSEAIARAERAGLVVVTDRSMQTEHERLVSRA